MIYGIICAMNICLFSVDEIEKPLSLNDERGVHILNVLHKKEGESFFAGIINGSSGIATITKITSNDIEYTFTPKNDGEKPLCPLKMIIGFPRPIQLKRLLRDMASIGVEEVFLIGTELGEKSYMKSTLSSHDAAYKMLLDGTVQAASTYIPSLSILRDLKECVSVMNRAPNASSVVLKVALDNVNPDTSLYSALKESCFGQTGVCQGGVNQKRGSVVAAIGSERGWTDNERAVFKENGFLRCGMGSRVMRTETASTVAASVIMAECGWLG